MKRSLPSPIHLSMYAAIFYSIVSITLELIRRWSQLLDPHYFITWFDEFIVAGLLLFAVRKTCRSLSEGQRFLSAAWGYASGMMFASFFIQLNNMHLPDPAPVPVQIVVIIKGIFFAFCLLCLMLSLLKIKDKELPRCMKKIP